MTPIVVSEVQLGDWMARTVDVADVPPVEWRR